MKVIKNYLYNLMYQILIIILPIITIPYVSRVLGAEGLGQYALTNTYSQYFVLMGMLGLATYSSREIAYVRDDKEKLSQTFWEINTLKFVTVGLSLLLYLLIFGVILDLNFQLVYIIQSLLILGSLVDVSWLFIGLEDFKNVVLKNILVKVVGIILIFGFVKESSHVWLYTLILAGTQFIGQIIMWFEIPSHIHFLLPKKENLITHLKYSIRFFIPQISITVYTMLDKVMLGALTNEAQVGMYDNSQKIIKIITTIVTMLAVVTLPKMANLYMNKQHEEFNNNVYKSFSFVSFLSFPMTFGLIGVSKSFVPWFFGPGFEEIIPMIYIGSFLVITLGWSSILGNQVLLSIKKERQFTIAVTAGAVINILLNFILIKEYKAIGTTISSIIAEYIGMFLMAYYLRDILDIRRLFKSVMKYLYSSLIMFFVVWVISLNMSPTVLNSLILVLVGGIIYVSQMILIGDENLKYALNFIKDRKIKN